MEKYPTRFTAKGIDSQCWARSCMWPGEHKGVFVQGRGYTSYFAKPKPVCMLNHLHGCPRVIPEPDPESARCCFRPAYRARGSAPTGHKECETCGAHAPLGIAQVLNRLVTLPGVPCKHQEAHSGFLIGWFECPRCRSFWDHAPAQFEPSQWTFEEMLAEARHRLNSPPRE